jgi:hypothetical protein
MLAGIKFVHLPMSSSALDPPSPIALSKSSRSPALWLIKRVLVDNWDNDRAVEEAAQLGLTNPALKKVGARRAP